VDLCGSQRGKSGHLEEADRGSFWRGTTIEIDTRLRVGRAIGKNEDEVAQAMMSQIKDHSNPIEPLAIVSDGCDSPNLHISDNDLRDVILVGHSYGGWL